MQQPHRWLLLAIVALGATVGSAPAQATMLFDHGLSADSFTLTPEANAPPEFGRCIKTTGGAYSNGACTETGSGGKYEWYAAFASSAPLEKAGFTSILKEGTDATLETAEKSTINCTGETSSGEITGNKTVGNVVATFTGCEDFEVPCQSAGSAAGTVTMNTLEGTLGVEELAAEPAHNKIGEKLYPVGHSGPIARFDCGSFPVIVTGAMISPVSSNSMKLIVTVKTKQSKGKQKPEAFVGETPELLTTQIAEGFPVQAGETITNSQTNAEKVEINSVV
jgi:hypothetical protein